MVVGAVTCVALAACNGSHSAQSAPTPERAVIDTMTFAPVLDVDLARFTRTRSGAYYRDDVRGSGAVAATDRRLTVKYVVSLPTGTVVETQTAPIDVILGPSVIRGWREGVPGMRAGGTRTIVVPPELAYGRSAHGSIPGQSTLIFEIQVLNVR